MEAHAGEAVPFSLGGHVSWLQLALLNERGEFRTTAIRKTPDIRNAVKATNRTETPSLPGHGRIMSAHVRLPFTPGPWPAPAPAARTAAGRCRRRADQRLVRALLDDAAAVEDQQPVERPHRRQPVGDDRWSCGPPSAAPSPAGSAAPIPNRGSRSPRRGSGSARRRGRRARCATRWRSPPDSLTPRSPTSVS